MSQKKEPPLDRLSPRQEALLKASKEIIVKFIESGRMSVSAFEEAFPQVYKALSKTMAEDNKK
ncbi:MAG: hypothetical protein KMY53_05700 [Desulfarculus sp.]|nr:hypothetical protein [Pseudomonadota bacterium]MBV1715442.1 hypothetical protein [Desulfarculus sp.]MBU4575506.1 hypothetical protein [Pseudomonadota bacterium]MBU4596211.1 hypothetical protein [Pseudomonadota bacterium]MBV1737637.1 hypothetical protein [Desulfarculus sp.]